MTRTVLVGLTLYVGGSIASVVLLSELDEHYAWLAIAPQFVACLVLGFISRPWPWALVGLILVPSLIAQLFHGPQWADYEGPPLDILELLFAPAYLAVALLGLGARCAIDARRRGPGSDRDASV